MIFGKFFGIADSWEHIIKEIWLRGEMNQTEYGLKSKFHNGLLVELTDLKPGWSSYDPFCSKNRVEEYKNQFIRGYTAKRVAEAKTDRDKELAAFKYTYMDRLTEPFDQIKWLRDQLLSGRIESRRTQAITWRVDTDCDAKNQDPPCLQSIFVYARKNKMLDIHIRYRSWDAFKGYPANINAIYWMVNEELLKPTGYRLSAFRCMGDNVHIYEDDFQAVERMAKVLMWR